MLAEQNRRLAEEREESEREHYQITQYFQRELLAKNGRIHDLDAELKQVLQHLQLSSCQKCNGMQLQAI